MEGGGGGGGQIFVYSFAGLACVYKAQWLNAILYVCFVDFMKDFIQFFLPIYTCKLLKAFNSFGAIKDIIVYVIWLGSTKFKYKLIPIYCSADLSFFSDLHL